MSYLRINGRNPRQPCQFALRFSWLALHRLSAWHSPAYHPTCSHGPCRSSAKHRTIGIPFASNGLAFARSRQDPFTAREATLRWPLHPFHTDAPAPPSYPGECSAPVQFDSGSHRGRDARSYCPGWSYGTHGFLPFGSRCPPTHCCPRSWRSSCTATLGPAQCAATRSTWTINGRNPQAHRRSSQSSYYKASSGSQSSYSRAVNSSSTSCRGPGSRWAGNAAILCHWLSSYLSCCESCDVSKYFVSSSFPQLLARFQVTFAQIKMNIFRAFSRLEFCNISVHYTHVWFSAFRLVFVQPCSYQSCVVSVTQRVAKWKLQLS